MSEHRAPGAVNGPPRKLDLEISRELGQIQAQLESMNAALSHITGEHKAQSGEFKADLRGVRDELKALGEKIGDVQKRQFAVIAVYILLGVLFGSVLTKYGISVLS